MAKIIFMGTPDFAVPILKALIQNHDVIGVITQPDRPAGRKQEILPSPIKQTALEAQIPVFQPEKIRSKTTIGELRSWQKTSPDLYVVAAFGQILPQEILDIPQFGSINVHASLLPRWRGAAPIQAAIRAGDTETGITIMVMDAGLDTGPMISSRSIPISLAETGQSLHDKLSFIGGELLIETIPRYLNGELQLHSQDDSLVTFAPQITKGDGKIDWTNSSHEIERQMRAFTPWPGTYTFCNNQPLKILSGKTIQGQAEAGLVVYQNGKIAIGTGEGLFCPIRVQLAGKKATTIEDFVRGYKDFVGTHL